MKVPTAMAVAGSIGITAGVLHRRSTLRRSYPSPPVFSGVEATVTASDGARLALTTAGSGPVVVFAHGWTESRSIWDAVAAELVDSGYRVVLYDQRGHGRSSIGDDGISIARLADDLRDILVMLDAHDCVVVGHSMGGMTVMALMGDHPDVVRDRVRAAVLVSTAAGGLGRKARLDALAARVVGSRLTTKAFAGRLGPRLTRRSLGRRANPAHASATAALFAATSSATRRDCYLAMSQMDLRSQLGAVDRPVKVVVGSRDHLTPPRFAKEIAGLIPGAQLIVVPDAGHQLPFEAPGDLTSIIASVTEQPPVPRGDASLDLPEGAPPAVDAADGNTPVPSPQGVGSR